MSLLSPTHRGTSIVLERVRVHSSVSGGYDLLEVQRFPDSANNNCVRGDFLPTPHFWGVPPGVGHRLFILGLFSPKGAFYRLMASFCYSLKHCVI